MHLNSNSKPLKSVLQKSNLILKTSQEAVCILSHKFDCFEL